MQALRLPARQGVFWLKDSFRLYRRNPIQLTAVASTYMMMLLLLGLLPWVGQILLPLVLPTLSVIVANACRAIDRGQIVTIALLRDEIAEQRVQLIRLGSLQLVLTMCVLLISQFLDDGQAKLALGEAATPEQVMAAIPYLLRTLAMTLPLMMAYWFAPLLAAWEGVTAVKSLFFSIVAVCRNWRAFLMFVLFAIIFGVIAPVLLIELPSLLIPDLRGILSKLVPLIQVFILLPVMLAASYVSYKDIFVSIENPDD